MDRNLLVGSQFSPDFDKNEICLQFGLFYLIKRLISPAVIQIIDTVDFLRPS
jgi:hypothetical protein